MNIAYIIEFVTLAETCSFSEAADQLFISQSSLSKHVKQLESELNVSLFDRSTRNVVLSPAGDAFLPYAKEFSNLWQGMQKTMSQLGSGEESQLTIGTMNPLKSYRIPNFINQFYQAHQGCHIITRSISQVNFRDGALQVCSNLFAGAVRFQL